MAQPRAAAPDQRQSRREGSTETILPPSRSRGLGPSPGTSKGRQRAPSAAPAKPATAAARRTPMAGRSVSVGLPIAAERPVAFRSGPHALAPNVHRPPSRHKPPPQALFLEPPAPRQRPAPLLAGAAPGLRSRAPRGPRGPRTNGSAEDIFPGASAALFDVPIRVLRGGGGGGGGGSGGGGAADGGEGGSPADGGAAAHTRTRSSELVGMVDTGEPAAEFLPLGPHPGAPLPSWVAVPDAASAGGPAAAAVVVPSAWRSRPGTLARADTSGRDRALGSTSSVASAATPAAVVAAAAADVSGADWGSMDSDGLARVLTVSPGTGPLRPRRRMPVRLPAFDAVPAQPSARAVAPGAATLANAPRDAAHRATSPPAADATPRRDTPPDRVRAAWAGTDADADADADGTSGAAGSDGFPSPGSGPASEAYTDDDDDLSFLDSSSGSEGLLDGSSGAGGDVLRQSPVRVRLRKAGSDPANASPEPILGALRGYTGMDSPGTSRSPPFPRTRGPPAARALVSPSSGDRQRSTSPFQTSLDADFLDLFAR